MTYKTQKRTSIGTEVLIITGDVWRIIGFIKQVGPEVYSADRGPYELGTFPSVEGAKAAIIHEFERPLSIEQAEAWNNRTGIYAPRLTYGPVTKAIYDRTVLITPVFFNDRRAGHIKQQGSEYTYAPKDERFAKKTFSTMVKCMAYIAENY